MTKVARVDRMLRFPPRIDDSIAEKARQSGISANAWVTKALEEILQTAPSEESRSQLEQILRTIGDGKMPSRTDYDSLSDEEVQNLASLLRGRAQEIDAQLRRRKSEFRWSLR